MREGEGEGKRRDRGKERGRDERRGRDEKGGRRGEGMGRWKGQEELGKGRGGVRAGLEHCRLGFITSNLTIAHVHSSPTPTCVYTHTPPHMLLLTAHLRTCHTCTPNPLLSHHKTLIPVGKLYQRGAFISTATELMKAPPWNVSCSLSSANHTVPRVSLLTARHFTSAAAAR